MQGLVAWGGLYFVVVAVPVDEALDAFFHGDFGAAPDSVGELPDVHFGVGHAAGLQR